MWSNHDIRLENRLGYWNYHWAGWIATWLEKLGNSASFFFFFWKNDSRFNIRKADAEIFRKFFGKEKFTNLVRRLKKSSQIGREFLFVWKVDSKMEGWVFWRHGMPYLGKYSFFWLRRKIRDCVPRLSFGELKIDYIGLSILPVEVVKEFFSSSSRWDRKGWFERFEYLDDWQLWISSLIPYWALLEGCT